MTKLEWMGRCAALFSAGLLSALLLEPLVIFWARKLGVMDIPNWRKIHENSVGRAGGLVFFPCLIIGCVMVLALWPVFWHPQYFGLMAAMGLVTLAGLWDDVYDLRASIKLLVQLGAGTILFFSGYRLDRVFLPFFSGSVDLGYLDPFITILAVATIINAVNMLDGLDGLAAGSVGIMCLFLFINKLVQGNLDNVAVLVIAMGACLGFLWYNFYPAKVFMGDAGSMFLGLLLASETLDSASRGAAITTILLPLVILGIPLLDMVRIMVTRFRLSRNVFAADKSHLHHRLLGIGLSHREAVLFIYGLNVYMGIMALLYRQVTRNYRALYLLALAMFLFFASYLIGVGHRKNEKTGKEPVA